MVGQSDGALSGRCPGRAQWQSTRAWISNETACWGGRGNQYAESADWSDKSDIGSAGRDATGIARNPTTGRAIDNQPNATNGPRPGKADS